MGQVTDPKIIVDFQVALSSWTVQVKGQGTLKIELRSATNALLKSWSKTVSSDVFTTITEPLPADLTPVKLLNVVAESPSNLTLDEISFGTRVPRLFPLRYAYLISYAQLLRTLDPATGVVRDHAQWPVGDFDAVPGMGFVALAAASAADLGFISKTDAIAIASKSIEALLAVPREPRTGWLPHWLKNGQRHPDSEWSTVDTALALLPAIQAATMLSLDSKRTSLQAMVDQLNFAAVTTSGQKITHGISAEGTVLPGTWDVWGGETALVQLLRGYRDPCLPDLSITHTPPAYGGRGFITELGALLVAELGTSSGLVDRWGINWRGERTTHYLAQRSHMGNASIFGLSPAEVISADGATGYLEAGIGTTNPGTATVDSLTSFGGPWRMPHYMGMTAALDVEASCQSAIALRKLGLMPPLSGPAESVLVGATGSVQRWHSVQTALNAFFNTIGYYHAVVVAEGRTDAIYQAVRSDPRFTAALGVMIPPAPVCAQATISLEAKAASGDGQSRPGSNVLPGFSAVDTGDGVAGWNAFTSTNVPGTLAWR
jgi:hypothetical protein